jgi:predicted P-loop ATPase
VNALSIAIQLIDRRIMPVPVPIGKKGPVIPEWQHLDITAENAAQYFNGAALNVGAIMGPKSGGLTDVDLDCAEAVALAPHFLPRTNSIYGRASKRRSHYLYTCTDPDAKASIKLTDETKACIVELRLGGGGKGAQSLMPGSVHTSGEVYAWDEDGERAVASCAQLKAANVKIAVGTVLMRHWPARGSRHDAALVVGGFLARAGWTPDGVEHFVETICRVHGEADDPAAHGRTARDSAEHYADGGQGYGLPQMAEVFGEDAVKCVAKLVGYRGSETRTSSEGFEVDAQGRKVARSQYNIRAAMEMLDVEVSYDLFHDRMLVTGLDGHTMLDDPAMEKLWLLIDERFRFLPPKDFFFIVVNEAERRSSFHPVRDYLDSLTWDGTERIDRWLVTYAGAADTEYVKAVGAITLVAAVRRVRQPGCKFDEMLIIESPQGRDKSSMLSTLAVHQEWFSDDLPLDADGKKVIEQLRGKWIVEAAEMSGMRKADVEHLKALLSRQVDRGRLAYGRITTEQPRQSIVVGTTNSTIYLKDLTDNRRFWPVKVETFDMAAISRDRDQLWAEAAAREKAGASIRLDPSLWEAARAEQQERTAEDPWLEQLAEVLGDVKGKLLSTDAWKIIDVDAPRRTQEQNARLGSAMKSLGFERKKARFDGELKWGYMRGSTDEREKQIGVVFENGGWRAVILVPPRPCTPPRTRIQDIANERWCRKTTSHSDQAHPCTPSLVPPSVYP